MCHTDGMDTQPFTLPAEPDFITHTWTWSGDDGPLAIDVCGQQQVRVSVLTITTYANGEVVGDASGYRVRKDGKRDGRHQNSTLVHYEWTAAAVAQFVAANR